MFPFTPTLWLGLWASQVVQRLKRLPGMQETRVRSLGREDPLEKEVATHSSTLAGRIPWREEPRIPITLDLGTTLILYHLILT